MSNTGASAKAWPLAALLIASAIGTALAQPPDCAIPTFSDQKSGEKVWRYQPNQICPPRPKFDYTDDGRTIMIKRFPYFPTQDVCHFQKYRFIENKLGIEHMQQGQKLKRQPDDMLTEEQKQVLREWGQPDYLRGPYKSTRFDSVIEWAYHPLNHLFQWVEGELVYEGPLTDQERVAITYGAPREATIRQLQPNIRRETWVYRPWFLSVVGMTSRERIFDFANGKLLYSQESP
jgi:hypothetical protein